MKKTKLEKSNAAHERLCDAHYYADVYGNDKSLDHFKLNLYHSEVLAKQRKLKRVLSSKEKRAIYKYINSLNK